MRGSNEDTDFNPSPTGTRSSFIETHGPIRDDDAVYSNITLSGGIYKRKQPAVDAPPPIAYWRSAQLNDIPKIERLITEYSIRAFGKIDLPYIMLERRHIAICYSETSLVCLVQINEASEIILFFAFSKTCQLPAIPASATPDFLELYYGLPMVKLPGTYMARLLLYDERYTGDTLRYILRSLFYSQQEVSFVLLILPGRLQATDFIKSVFMQVNVIGLKNAENLQTVHVCHRHSVVERIYTRIAEGQEGIRDTSSIFKHHAEAIQQKYGDFSLKELIENPESRVVLYSEAKYRNKTRPAVITVLNSEVNLELINSNFETLPFYGFKVPHAKDVIQINGWEETVQLHVRSRESSEVEEKKSGGEEEVKETRWAREARLAAEKIERQRRRLHSPEHYLSQLSLTEDELHEPNDPFHVADALWDQIDDDNTPGATATTQIKKIRKKGKRGGGGFFHKEEKIIQDYRGVTNAFIIELILNHPDFGDRLGSWYLRTLFNVYPGLDYCLLTLPHAYPDIPLLKYFAVNRLKRAERKCAKCFKCGVCDARSYTDL